MRTINFRSDNNPGAEPYIIDAFLAEAALSNDGYGRDSLTGKLNESWSEVFETEVSVLPVSTGTVANALALSFVAPSHGRVYCHEHSHIVVDEVNSPGFFVPGLTFSPLQGEMGKVDADAFSAALDEAPWGAVNCAQPAALSITQASEFGTVYRSEEIRALAMSAHSRGLRLHMDGARLANAIVTLNVSPADATWRCGVDVLSLGASKNGCFLTEAVVVFGRHDVKPLWYKSKQSGHLSSKLRFLAAQLIAYAAGDRWLDSARRANRAALRLVAGLAPVSAIDIINKVEANIVFARISPGLASRLRAQGFQFHSRVRDERVRFVTSFDTSDQDVDCLVAACKEAAAA